ncbi:hypothetical protein [Liquorilactobacillus sicerae]|uniref:hypothetical protein n=1 Tax=Liquorilactobacillus sicerae TaxID=1416943 RepID=UPI0024808803|nr:hypothetical protein [Liquorilactobacillus sicerae]
MLKTKKICRIFFQAEISKDFALACGWLLAEILWFIILIFFNQSQRNLNTLISSCLIFFIIVFAIVSVCKVTVSINQTWSKNKYRLLPVKSGIFYFSNLIMRTLAALLVSLPVIGLNLLTIMVNPKFIKSLTNINFDNQNVIKVGMVALMFYLLMIIKATFLWLVAVSLANFFKPRWQDLVCWGSFFCLFFALASLGGQVEKRISNNIFDWRVLVINSVTLILCMIGSILLLKSQVETQS